MMGPAAAAGVAAVAAGGEGNWITAAAYLAVAMVIVVNLLIRPVGALRRGAAHLAVELRQQRRELRQRCRRQADGQLCAHVRQHHGLRHMRANAR